MANKKDLSTLTVVGEICVSVAAILWCITIIGMIWGIPMFRGNQKRLNGEMPITVSHVVLSILFFWWIGGLLVAIGGNVE